MQFTAGRTYRRMCVERQVSPVRVSDVDAKHRIGLEQLHVVVHRLHQLRPRVERVREHHECEHRLRELARLRIALYSIGVASRRLGHVVLGPRRRQHHSLRRAVNGARGCLMWPASTDHAFGFSGSSVTRECFRNYRGTAPGGNVARWPRRCPCKWPRRGTAASGGSCARGSR